MAEKSRGTLEHAIDHRRATMSKLAAMTDEITRSVPQGVRVGYLDYPLHTNLGDLLIFLGTMEFFSWNRNELVRSFSAFDAGKRAVDGLDDVDVVVCHGGGNFGDLYPRHQGLREKIVQRFPDKSIVVFPQSLHFGSESALRASARIFRRHRDVTIYARDEASYDVARTHFSDRVHLSPDLAHRLHRSFEPVRAAVAGGRGTLRVLRRDIERADCRGSTEGSVDWRDVIRFGEKLRLQDHRTRAKLRGFLNLSSVQAVYSYHRVVSEVARAVAERLIDHERWITSRLHGAILGLLLDREVDILDNFYGKSSRYFALWGPSLVSRSRDPCEMAMSPASQRGIS